MSRDPEMFVKPGLIEAFKEGCIHAGHNVIITNVDRCELEQIALYSQGRKPLDVVNMKRMLAGLSPISESHNKIVTWTLASKHIPVIVSLDDKYNPVKKSRAFDFAIIKDGKVCWNIKADLDLDGESDYLECGIIAESLGLVWGGRWKKPDFAHCQYMKQV